MGSVGKVLSDAVSAVTLGTVDLNKNPKVKTNAAAQLEQDRTDNSKKRKALYGTQGGVLGQEVTQVGNTNRGNLFGN
nr:MAG TPA: hypothetical protein [Caudoviricetes sp.]